MKPKDVLNIVVAGFGLYSLWKAFACAVAIALMNLGIDTYTEATKGFYLAWFVIGLVLGIVLLRYGARLLSWMLPDNWPDSEESKRVQPEE